MPRLATRLWSEPDFAAIDANFFPDFLANSLLPAPMECDHSLQTAATGWLRVPRGQVLCRDHDGRVDLTAELTLPALALPAGTCCADLEAELVNAIDNRIDACSADQHFSSELSGGIDSGIIVARAAKRWPGKFLGGIALHCDYHELRRERHFIELVASQACVPLTVIDIAQHLPFSDLSRVPAHDEPSISSIPWRLMQASLEAASALGSRVHLHGIGGDQVFVSAPSEYKSLNTGLRRLRFATPRLRRAIARQRRLITDHYFGGGQARFSERATMLYDGWTDRYVAPATGVRFESGYLSWQIIRLCEALRAREEYRRDIYKPVPRIVFRDDLPEAVRNRRGKVGFDGVYQRGLRQNLDDVAALVERYAGSLERLEVRPGILMEQLFHCARTGWDSTTTPVLAVLSWIAWQHGLVTAGLASDRQRPTQRSG